MATKNGIEYDLTRTPYSSTWDYYTFFFSSATHLEKFEYRRQARIDWLCDSLSRRFHVEIDASVLAVFQLYMQIETRGFRVWDILHMKELECPENITFRGMRPNVRDSILQPENTTTPCAEQPDNTRIMPSSYPPKYPTKS